MWRQAPSAKCSRVTLLCERMHNLAASVVAWRAVARGNCAGRRGDTFAQLPEAWKELVAEIASQVLDACGAAGAADRLAEEPASNLQMTRPKAIEPGIQI